MNNQLLEEITNEYLQEKFFVVLGKHKNFICGAEPKSSETPQK